jgi:hypothetical protein
MSRFTTAAGPVLILLSFLFLGCKDKKSSNGGANPDVRIDVPESLGTDDLVVAHLRVGDTWNSTLVKEVLAELGKAGEGKDMLAKARKSVESQFGFWPGDIDTITFVMPEFPGAPGPKFAAILTSTKAFDKQSFLMTERRGSTQRQGFVALKNGLLLHFPDNKTAVVVHESLADKYLAGYARDKSGWPMSDGLKKAAEGHTLLMSVNLDKAPAEVRDAKELGEFAALSTCKSFTFVGDFKGKEIVLGLRGKFPDDASSKKAQELISNEVKELASLAGKDLDEPNAQEKLGAAIALVKEAKRALNDMSVAASGSDLTVKASFNVDFNVGQVVADGVKTVHLAAERSKSQNNLRQLALGMVNYADVYGKLIVSGTGAMGQPIKSLDEKPLLSWRVALLPYLDHEALYKQFKLDEPWDSEHNKNLIAKMPNVFAPVNNPKGGGEGKTYYQMVIGPRAMRPGFSIVSIPDGASNTIAIVEAAEPVTWTKPEDIFIPGMEMPKGFRKKFGGLFKDTIVVALFDGSIRNILSDVSDRTLWLAVQPDDGQPPPKDW